MERPAITSSHYGTVAKDDLKVGRHLGILSIVSIGGPLTPLHSTVMALR